MSAPTVGELVAIAEGKHEATEHLCRTLARACVNLHSRVDALENRVRIRCTCTVAKNIHCPIHGLVRKSDTEEMAFLDAVTDAQRPTATVVVEFNLPDYIADASAIVDDIRECLRDRDAELGRHWFAWQVNGYRLLAYGRKGDVDGDREPTKAKRKRATAAERAHAAEVLRLVYGGPSAATLGTEDE